MQLDDVGPFIGPDALRTYRRALERITELTRLFTLYFKDALPRWGVVPDNVCAAVLGSSGRAEALDASDFDLLPVARDEATLATLLEHNDEIREGLRAALGGLDVAKGRDLLKSVSLTHLIDPDCIGGEKDDRPGLTQRVLLLTESRQVGGGLRLSEIRRSILEAYAHHRSAGRHPMAYCNDLARYYRTVCIDYKSRVDTRDKDWCTRNVKLRHARKLWYFANILSVCAILSRTRADNPQFVNELLETLDLPPTLRMFVALDPGARVPGGRVLDQYAWYLAFMGDQERRNLLATVVHDRRYEPSIDNPYPALQWNSRVLHSEMIGILDCVAPELRRRVLDWFLL